MYRKVSSIRGDLQGCEVRRKGLELARPEHLSFSGKESLFHEEKEENSRCIAIRSRLVFKLLQVKERKVRITFRTCQEKGKEVRMGRQSGNAGGKSGAGGRPR